MRHFLLLILLCVAFISPAVAAPEDVKCVQSYLIATPYLDGAADGKLGKKAVEASAAFVEALRLGEQLPPLNDDTAAQWCAFSKSEAGLDIAVVASLRIYEIDPTNLANIDDGRGPLTFDFGKYKLADSWGGYSCRFYMIGNADFDDSSILAEGSIRIDDKGRVKFKGGWHTGGLSSKETFDRANIAITKSGELVGRFLVFNLFYKRGDIPSPPVNATFQPKGGRLTTDNPHGSIRFKIEGDTDGRLDISQCQRKS